MCVAHSWRIDPGSHTGADVSCGDALAGDGPSRLRQGLQIRQDADPALTHARPVTGILRTVNTTLLTELFEGGSTPLIRTDFSDNDVWERIAAAVSAPVDFGTDFDGQLDDEDDGYAPNVTPISDPSYDGVTGEALAAALTTDAVGYVLLADQQAMADAEDLTVAYVDLNHEPGRTFRCAVGEVASIESNLSISNMDFEEFADNVGPDGVFRGFED